MSDDDSNPVDPGGVDPTEPLIVPASDLPPTEAMAAQPPIVGDGMHPTDPNAALAGGPPPHWYDNRAALGGVIAVGLIALFLLIGWLVWWSDDDESDLVADSTTTTAVSTIPPASIVDGSTLPTVETTVPESSTSTSTTTTSTTTTTTTTIAPTTVPATTAPATTAAPTTAPATTTTVPVVTVPPGPAATVLDIVLASPDLSRLAQLIQDAGIAAELDGENAVTLFAPSNPAIETLEAAPGGAELLADPDQLRALLLRHVVADELDIAAVFDTTELPTLNGDTLVVDAAAQTVDGATLLVTDVAGANGFLHVVDRVLIDRTAG